MCRVLRCGILLSTRISVSKGVLTLKAQGATPHESGPLLFVAGAHNYEISVKVEKDSAAVAGIVLFYNGDFYVGAGFDSKRTLRWRKAQQRGGSEQRGKNKLWLKIHNNHDIITGYYSYDGKNWKKETWGMDISGYHHNTLYDFLSVMPGLFAYGNGEVRFSDLQFTQLE